MKGLSEIVDTTDKLLDEWDVDIVQRLDKGELIYMVAYLVGLCNGYKYGERPFLKTEVHHENQD